jgi:hypothetical protein
MSCNSGQKLLRIARQWKILKKIMRCPLLRTRNSIVRSKSYALNKRSNPGSGWSKENTNGSACECRIMRDRKARSGAWDVVDATEVWFWGRMVEGRVSYWGQIRADWSVGVGIVGLSSMSFYKPFVKHEWRTGLRYESCGINNYRSSAGRRDQVSLPMPRFQQFRWGRG